MAVSKIKELNDRYLRLYSEFDNITGRIQSGTANLNFDTTNKKNDFYGFGFNGRPIKTYDFYEPRSDNQLKFVNVPENLGAWFYFSSNLLQ